jgi:two-component system sensor histidine kinase RpfC
MDACLPKPVEPAELFRVIDRLTAGAADRGEAKPAAASIVTDIAAHPRFRGDARPAIDGATIAELEALGGRSFVRELAEQFVEEGGRIMADLGSAVARNDVHYFRDRLHALRSGAANVGARGLYDLCMAQRSMSSAEFAANGVAKVNEIEAEFERVEVNLRDYSEQEGTAAAMLGASVARLPRKTPG